MRNILSLFLGLLFLAAVQSCKAPQNLSAFDQQVEFDTIEVKPDSSLDIYRGSTPIFVDLIHTKLAVSFNWDSAFLYGQAQLKMKAHFYPVTEVELDAKGFQIKEVAMLDEIGKKSALPYSYNGKKLKVKLSKTYTKTDTFQLYIDYVAMPNKLEVVGSDAITSDKGLYFINNDGSDPDKPKQIWTQGETEASSCWFPTFDSPNQKSTQEIAITLDSQYVSLSNGTLLFQTENEDGSRTDFWKQNKPHSPYLFMMAIGEYAVVKDTWNGIPVNYYVEKEFKDYAREIFPHTLEMLSFFSKKLDYAYPWDKFDQVVVRDYVSGAMENTGAVIYGEFMQGNHRYLIDESGEEVVAHELFHHWFGDLVTTESWSNLPLNESFATYGEYLWNEYKYGLDEANYYLNIDLKAYLLEARYEKKPLIRYHYHAQEDMFDAHSYQKGGRVLHQLRNTVGDEAFFEGISLYLKENAFQNAEISDLRKALEKVTGHDLNWFFNQWFFHAGHPELEVTKEYDSSAQKLLFTVKQVQTGENIPLVYQIPTTVEVVHNNGKVEFLPLNISKREETFAFEMQNAPIVARLDADNTLLAQISQPLSEKEARALYRKDNDYMDRNTALLVLENSSDEQSLAVIQAALNDAFWGIRRTALKFISKLAYVKQAETFSIVKKLAAEDEESVVRAAAYDAIASDFNELISLEELKKGMDDSSYLVVSSCLSALYAKDPNEGIKAAKLLENDYNEDLISAISRMYAEDGKESHQAYFQSALENNEGFVMYSLLSNYGDFLEKQDLSIMKASIPQLVDLAEHQEKWWYRMAAINALHNMKEKQNSLLAPYQSQLNDEPNNQDLVKKINDIALFKKEISNILQGLMGKEKEGNLRKMIKGYLN